MQLIESSTLFSTRTASLLCLECLDSHGQIGHVILSSEGAAEILSEKLAEFHRQLKDKQVLMAHLIQELTEMEAQFVRSSESFEEFSGQIFSVFQRIEEILGELKTSIFTKYMSAQEFEQRSSAAQIKELRKSSAQLEKSIRQIESDQKGTSNKSEQSDIRGGGASSGCRRDGDGDGECRGSRARPTAATVALDVLQTLRAQLQHAEEQLSAGSSL